MAIRAIGSSYLIRQASGSERIGGLRVTLRANDAGSGTVDVHLTDWITGDPLNNTADVKPMALEAVRGLEEALKEFGIPLEKFDILLSHFVYHPVDSSPRVYNQAARSALRSAIEAWNSRDF